MSLISTSRMKTSRSKRSSNSKHLLTNNPTTASASGKGLRETKLTGMVAH